jgi:hypothetical protein
VAVSRQMHIVTKPTKSILHYKYLVGILMLRAFRFILVDFCSFTNGEVMACLSFKIFF